jgi:hypothetical protein
VELYLYSPIRLHGVVLNSLSTGTTLSFTFTIYTLSLSRGLRKITKYEAEQPVSGPRLKYKCGTDHEKVALHSHGLFFVLQLFNMKEDQEIRRYDVRWRFSIKSRIHRLLET